MIELRLILLIKSTEVDLYENQWNNNNSKNSKKIKIRNIIQRKVNKKMDN